MSNNNNNNNNDNNNGKKNNCMDISSDKQTKYDTRETESLQIAAKKNAIMTTSKQK